MNLRSKILNYFKGKELGDNEIDILESLDNEPPKEETKQELPKEEVVEPKVELPKEETVEPKVDLPKEEVETKEVQKQIEVPDYTKTQAHVGLDKYRDMIREQRKFI
jgi:hypothetical protein